MLVRQWNAFMTIKTNGKEDEYDENGMKKKISKIIIRKFLRWWKTNIILNI